jgi:hypothetical protein
MLLPVPGTTALIGGFRLRENTGERQEELHLGHTPLRVGCSFQPTRVLLT